MKQPGTCLVRQFDTHRLIPSKFSASNDSVLGLIADDDGHLQDLFELDHATNERLLAENNLLPGVDVRELVFGLPYYRIVNAAFCHANPLGSRFGSAERGVWYAAFEIETSQAEVAFHKGLELAEVGWFHEVVTYDDYLSDISAQLHDLRDDPELNPYLDPRSYRASQELAELLLDNGSLGVVYPSVRHAGGTCVACFRPALVGNVRKGPSYELRWQGERTPVIRSL
jgi:hypothetical protein